MADIALREIIEDKMEMGSARGIAIVEPASQLQKAQEALIMMRET